MQKKRVAVAVGIVLVLAGVAWAVLAWRPNPQVAKVVALQEKVFAEDAPRENRREAFDELRREAEKLSPEERGQLMRDHPPPFMRRMQQNIVAFFDLPEDQRVAALDKQIDEMEGRRKEWEKRRAERGGEGRRGPPGGFRGRSTDPAQRNAMRKRMLDNTTAQQRAMFGEYFKQLAARRQQRGLPGLGGPFGN